MSTAVTEYLATLPEPVSARIGALYAEALRLVPEASEGVSYAMPSLLYRGRGLLSIMSTKKHIGVYPHGNLGELAPLVHEAGLTSTKGSVHLRAGEALPLPLLAQFVFRRKALIDAALDGAAAPASESSRPA